MYTYIHVRIFFKTFKITSNFTCNRMVELMKKRRKTSLKLPNYSWWKSSLPVAIFILTTKIVVRSSLLKLTEQFLINSEILFLKFKWSRPVKKHKFHHPRMICAKFGWNWHSKSGDKEKFRAFDSGEQENLK